MLSIIGDVHGKSNDYLQLAQQLEAKGYKTFQLGDMGFDYFHMRQLDVSKHRFMCGNHDNYNAVAKYEPGPHSYPRISGEYNVGRYGYFDEWADCPPFFYLSGGFSVDKALRTLDIDYWANEELSAKESDNAIQLYKEIRPDLLICHEPPYSFGRQIGSPEVLRYFGFDPDTFASYTSRLLDAMIQLHQPKVVVCGHFHMDRDETISGVRYICVDELSWVNIDRELNIS